MTAILDQDFDYTPAPGADTATPADAMAALDQLLRSLAPATTVAATLPKAYHAAAAAYAAARATGAAPYKLTDTLSYVAPNPKRATPTVQNGRRVTTGYRRYQIFEACRGQSVAAYFAAIEAADGGLHRGWGATELTYNLKRGHIAVSA